MYHRLGHVNQIFVKVGDKIKKGQKIATNGTGNGQWYAHCHYDIFKEKQTNWNRYNIGWSEEDTKKVWVDPSQYVNIVMPNLDHYGLRWLEYWDYDSQSKKVVGAKKPCRHPGADLNGPGAGNMDYDDPLHSPVDGIVEHLYSGTGSNDGWGRLIIIKEEDMQVKSKLRNAIEDITGKDYGKMDTEELQEKAGEDLHERTNQWEEFEKTYHDLVKIEKEELKELKEWREGKRTLSQKSSPEATELPQSDEVDEIQQEIRSKKSLKDILEEIFFAIFKK